MSVFEFEGESGESQPDEAEDDESVKSVTALESANGDGYTTIRATLPSDFVNDMDISGGDILLMKHMDDSDEIRVTKP